MHRKQISFFALLTAAVALILSFFVGSTIHFVNTTITTNCFNELTNAVHQLSDELYSTADMDQTILKAMAGILTSRSNMSDDELCDVLRIYDTKSSYISYVELLRPDGTILDADGGVRDVSGQFDFAAEAADGNHFSGIEYSTLDPTERVIRSTVPVVKNGKVIYILLGVVRLSDLAEKYTTDIYDGHAYVYLIDGTTGDFLLDTWHKSQGNLSEMSKRQTLPGYRTEDAVANMKNGVAGSLGFVSKTTGGVLYMCYEPAGINNWVVAVTVEEEYALEDSLAISSRLYQMAVVISIVLLLYTACITFWLLGAYRQVWHLGRLDQTTGLLNRTAYEKYLAAGRAKTFAAVACIYVDVNGLHEINNKYGHAAGDKMLRLVADALRGEFDEKHIYRVGGDEFVIFWENADKPLCDEKMARVLERLAAHDYSAAYGVAFGENETGLDRLTQQADEKMLENKRRYYANSECRLPR